jgi:hypothetical protein
MVFTGQFYHRMLLSVMILVMRHAIGARYSPRLS